MLREKGEDIEKKRKETIIGLGIPSNCKGLDYLLYFFNMFDRGIGEDDYLMIGICKKIADENNTKPVNVYANIKNLLDRLEVSGTEEGSTCLENAKGTRGKIYALYTYVNEKLASTQGICSNEEDLRRIIREEIRSYFEEVT